MGHKSSIACGTLPRSVEPSSHTTHLLSSLERLIWSEVMRRSVPSFRFALPFAFIVCLFTDARKRDHQIPRQRTRDAPMKLTRYPSSRRHAFSSATFSWGSSLSIFRLISCARIIARNHSDTLLILRKFVQNFIVCKDHRYM